MESARKPLVSKSRRERSLFQDALEELEFALLDMAEYYGEGGELAKLDLLLESQARRLAGKLRIVIQRAIERLDEHQQAESAGANCWSGVKVRPRGGMVRRWTSREGECIGLSNTGVLYWRDVTGRWSCLEKQEAMGIREADEFVRGLSGPWRCIGADQHGRGIQE